MLDTIINGIDKSINKLGRLSSLLIIPLILVVIFEVFMRYALNAPTIWAFEATAFIYGIHYMLGLSYTENTGGHVRVDILVGRFSPRVQAVFGIATMVGIFFPVFILMTYSSFVYFWTSFAEREVNSTSWAPPIYPVKFLMALSFLLLLIQGLSTLLKHIRTLKESK